MARRKPRVPVLRIARWIAAALVALYVVSAFHDPVTWALMAAVYLLGMAHRPRAEQLWRRLEGRRAPADGARRRRAPR